MKPHFYSCVLFGLLLSFATTLKSQTERVSLEGTERFEVKSLTVGDTYEAWVALPMGYARSSQNYKTLYVLDANLTFGMVRDIQILNSFEPGNPPMIIVGIAYSDFNSWISKRSRDYMAKSLPAIPGSGAAEKYLSFLENELIPEIEKRYRTTEERIIYGHSTAALFGFYSLLQSPRLFNGYILTSPSVDEDDQFTLNSLQQWEKNAGDTKARIYTSVGTLEKEVTQNGVAQLNEIMNAKMGTNLVYQSGRITGTHMNSMAQALINGLQFVNQ